VEVAPCWSVVVRVITVVPAVVGVPENVRLAEL
jgi:hypothetical protein